MHGDAWRILLHAVQGWELLPTHVQDYAKRALARAGFMPFDRGDVSPSKKSRTEEPGSASATVSNVWAGVRRLVADAFGKNVSAWPRRFHKISLLSLWLRVAFWILVCFKTGTH